MQQNNIKLVPITENLEGELSEVIYYECTLCGKVSGFFPHQRKLCEKLSGNSFYCNFCIQNNLNNKNNRHLLILSFRSIFGYYYHTFYNKKLYYSQIEGFINQHQKTGLSYPFLQYDPESYLWFVDFNKIGRGKKKIPVAEVLKATINIMACFNLPLIIENFKTSVLYIKYADAILKFYTHRYRPENRKLLIPTLLSCGGAVDSKNIDHELYRNFTISNFVIKKS